MTEPRSVLSVALLLACSLACEAAWAQAPQPSGAASAAERAQKETDRTMYWIRVLADKPAVARAAPPVPAPKPAAAVAVAPSPKPPAEARERIKVASAATTTAPELANAAPVPAPVSPLSKLSQPSAGNGLDPNALGGGVVDNAAPVAPLGQDMGPSLPAEDPDSGLIQVKSVQPDFPRTTLLRVRKGNVEVKFEVEPGGAVTEASVVDSSNSRLNDAAVEAVRQWRFKPSPKSHTALVNLVFNIDTEK